ncbi:MAG: ATP-binding protein [Pseudomonadota bacterium]
MTLAFSLAAGIFAVGALVALFTALRPDEGTGVPQDLSGAIAREALVRGATAAVMLSADGGRVTCGQVPQELLLALENKGSPLGRDVEGLLGGSPFETDLPDGTRRITGAFFEGQPTLFVIPTVAERASSAVGERLTALIAQAPFPAWVEGGGGANLWTNKAYHDAVGAGAESLLDANAAAQSAPAEGARFSHVATVVRGERRVFDVAAAREDGQLAALAVDVTEPVRLRTHQARVIESHAATLDRLATAVAIYGPDRRLAFHNAAFEKLWALPAEFLGQAPPEERVLDRLRADRRLPETADFKAWKRDQLRTYETREGFERWWHLPDGQTLRVVANPGSDGGVTYIYENVTEQLALERRYNALSRTQGETIDNLGEGVASFGPDGLLRLANPAFWVLSGANVADVGEHIRTVAGSAPPDMAESFAELTNEVTGLTDHRVVRSGRVERESGRILDYAFAPLPDGSTLATFADVTDTVAVARALVERNAALEEADTLKNAFIEHVSYELRSPLNTIIGFTQLLTRPDTGPLTDRQREYATYISSSSEALLAIIDGILDLATIDAGIMELSIAPVDLAASLGQVLDGLRGRIGEGEIEVETQLAPDATHLEADGQRVRQVLFNLLSNAIAHSPYAGTVTVVSRREGNFVSISVRDRGPGIASDKAEAVFERFNTSATKGRRGGVGLGLSLVKSFVELHGGTVAIAEVDGPGAEVVVRMPRSAQPVSVSSAA